MKILVTGATGLVGAEVIRQAIKDPAITEVIALTRNPTDIQHSRLKTIIHKDFLKYDNLGEVLKDVDACLWCLGISQSQVSKEQYHVITHDYALAAANAMLQANPDITFLFVSGNGADSTEKSRILFARVKGKTENALQRLPFKRLFIIRPGAIKPINKNPRTFLFNKLAIPLFSIMEFLIPSRVITSVDLAKTLLHIVKHGTSTIISENPSLKQIAKDLT